MVTWGVLLFSVIGASSGDMDAASKANTLVDVAVLAEDEHEEAKDDVLRPAEFVEALVRIAVARYKKKSLPKVQY